MTFIQLHYRSSYSFHAYLVSFQRYSKRFSDFLLHVYFNSTEIFGVGILGNYTDIYSFNDGVSRFETILTDGQRDNHTVYIRYYANASRGKEKNNKCRNDSGHAAVQNSNSSLHACQRQQQGSVYRTLAAPARRPPLALAPETGRNQSTQQQC